MNLKEWFNDYVWRCKNLVSYIDLDFWENIYYIDLEVDNNV